MGVTIRTIANVCVKSEDRRLRIHAGNLPGPVLTSYDLSYKYIHGRVRHAYS